MPQAYTLFPNRIILNTSDLYVFDIFYFIQIRLIITKQKYEEFFNYANF